MATFIIEARGVRKTFPGVVALDDVSFGLTAGEIHCLVGENGAGKSTLIKVFAGQYSPDQGELLLDGQRIHFSSPADALAQKISVVYQDLQLVPYLSVAENISLGQWTTKSGLINRTAMIRRAEGALEEVGTYIDPMAIVATLSTAKQQLVEIARALSHDTRVLILDEPTAALSESEANSLFVVLERLRQSGMALLYVSHRLEEVFLLGDRVTVLRDGKYIGTRARKEVTPDQVVSMMVGNDVSLYPDRKHRPRLGNKLLEVRELSLHGVIDKISLDLHAGEILGLAGIVGAGRTEFAQCLFGVTPAESGEIRIEGRPVNIKSPRSARNHGLALVPEDRKTQGIISILSVRENTSLGVLHDVSRWGWLDFKKEKSLVTTYRDRLSIKTASLESQILTLSGGNQQKVIIARWLATVPKILILDEPTQGIDVGAKAEIHALIEELVAGGLGIILISSELPELLAMSDRVLVMRKGRVVAELDGKLATKEEVIRFAAGSNEVAA
jgi:ABC-type sugar transport system ATPase subunit